jgi:hypothetical protein
MLLLRQLGHQPVAPRLFQLGALLQSRPLASGGILLMLALNLAHPLDLGRRRVGRERYEDVVHAVVETATPSNEETSVAR